MDIRYDENIRVRHFVFPQKKTGSFGNLKIEITRISYVVTWSCWNGVRFYARYIVILDDNVNSTLALKTKKRKTSGEKHEQHET